MFQCDLDTIAVITLVITVAILLPKIIKSIEDEGEEQ